MPRSPAALLAALALLSLPHPAAARDCDGGSLLELRLTAHRIRLTATVTRRGVTHDTLLGGNDFHLVVKDANDLSVALAEIVVPAAHFVTRGSHTRYDRRGAFDGSITLRNHRTQADTVKVSVKTSAAAVTGLDATRELRAILVTGTDCARTCVATCPARNGRVRCPRSSLYEPFADEGFGRSSRPLRPAVRSSLCGLAIDPAARCDFLIDDHCVLPYPSSYFLAPDATTPTGLRVSYGPASLPASTFGKHIDPTDWNTLDGMSPGPMILALFPDTGAPVDLAASDVAFHTNFARSLDADHPTVLLDAASGERVVHFAELDARTTNLARRAFILRPGRRLDDATRYIVALRNLVDTNGTPIRPRLPFRALRDGGGEAAIARACGSACAAAFAARLPTFTDVFARLAAAGVDPADLILAWDFTTASTEALTAWMVSIRDQAFALGTPSFTVTSVDDGGGAGRNADIFARIQGTFQAPLFMTANAPASRLNLVGGVPTQNGFAPVPFVVDVPRSAVNVGGDPQPARASLWGHGLLGDRFQVGGLAGPSNQGNIIFAGVDMQGMSAPDVLGAIVPFVLTDFSNFHFIPERLHQGFLNHLLLGRLLADPVAGFDSDPAFRFGPAATPIIDTTQVFYSGGSQGGIFGIAIMSIAEDFRRGFLSVPAANYSTLLDRATPFKPFFQLLAPVYPDPLDQEVGIALAQQLWDRAEPQGYMNHLLAGDLSDPPVPHKVLIHMATYDSQVSNLGTEIMVRSLEIPQLLPVHRTFFGIPEMAAPFDGSAFVEVDPGRGFSRCNVPGGDSPGAACTTDADCPGAGDPPARTRCDSGIPPLANLPGAFENGAHGSASFLPAMVLQTDAFLRTGGTVEQFCVGPCDLD